MESLLDGLREARGKGRNDYPIETLWEGVLNALQGKTVDLPPHALSRFVKNLLANRPLLDQAIGALIDEHARLHPHFGQTVIFDELPLVFPRQRRSDPLADDGEKSEGGRIFKWHGYRLHTILEAKTALPLAFTITPASTSGKAAILPLLDTLLEQHPEVKKRLAYALGDASFDSEELIVRLWQGYRIKPLFQLTQAKSCALLTPLSADKNVVVSDCGEVFCVHPSSKEKFAMSYAGFEEKRGSLKFRCIATSYNSPCQRSHKCTAKSGVRIPMSTNPHLFTPVARSSYKWQALTALLKNTVSYHNHLNETLKLHHIRGLEKLSLYTLLSYYLKWARISSREAPSCFPMHVAIAAKKPISSI